MRAEGTRGERQTEKQVVGVTVWTTETFSPCPGQGTLPLLTCPSQHPHQPQVGRPALQRPGAGNSAHPSQNPPSPFSTTPGSPRASALQGLSCLCRGEGFEAGAFSPGPPAGLRPTSYLLRSHLTGNPAPTRVWHPQESPPTGTGSGLCIFPILKPEKN